jgi:hypothetical protein
MKYEVGDKSRFAGDGHEYHCLNESKFTCPEYQLRGADSEQQQSGRVFFVQETRHSIALRSRWMQMEFNGQQPSREEVQHINVGTGTRSRSS